jgi:NitT/TauT family transport system substrate-binding protein
MSKEITPTGLDFDPAIQNPKAAPRTQCQNRLGWSRREFLTNVSLVGSSVLFGLKSDVLATDPPLETTELRVFYRSDAACSTAPVLAAEELLRSEGFSNLQYIKTAGGAGAEKALASGDAHIGLHYAAPLVSRIEAGDPVVVLAGGHVGCFELFANEKVRAILDLKGKTVAVPGASSTPGALLKIMLSQVGLDPNKDVRWVIDSATQQVRLLTEGKIDAFLAFAPTAQELRAKKIGHVVLNSALDRPWSQYFCCVLTGNREFVKRNPVATKRAVRAILKATDVCTLDPERTARLLVDRGPPSRPEYALQMLRDLPYSKWRDYDPEDTVRFYALRLHEIGMIKSSPQKIIAQGTDWRFLRELKKELKA